MPGLYVHFFLCLAKEKPKCQICLVLENDLGGKGQHFDVFAEVNIKTLYDNERRIFKVKFYFFDSLLVNLESFDCQMITNDQSNG